MTCGLAFVLVFLAMPALADASNPAEAYYSSPTARMVLDPAVIRLIADAHMAIEAERPVAEAWQKAQAEYRLDAANAKAAAPSERAKAEQIEFKAAAEFHDAATALAARKKATDEATMKAIGAVKTAYGLAPPKTDFSDANATKHDLQAWNPAFDRAEVYDPQLGRGRLRHLGEIAEEKVKNANRAKSPGAYLGTKFGETMADDGRMSIYGAAFDPAKPELLAVTIYHETVHWADFMSGGGLDKNEIPSPTAKFQTEVNAYRKEAEFYRKLGKLKESADSTAAADQFAVQVQISASRGLNWRTILTVPEYRAWLGVDRPLQRRGALDDSRGDPDVEDEALREIQETAAALDGRVRSESDARLGTGEAGLSAGMRNREVTVWASNEAIRCGLEPTDTGRASFEVPGNPIRVTMQYKDPQSYKASLLLFWACDRADGPPPCNDAMDTIRARWEEEAFRDALYLREGSEPGRAACVAHLVNARGRPGDFKALQRVAVEFWEARLGAAATTRPPAPTDPPVAPRPPRERQTPAPTGPPTRDCLRDRCIHW